MKTSTFRLFSLVALFFVASLDSSATAQSRIYEKDLAGQWKLTLDLRSEGESALERVLLGAVDNLVDEVDVRFEFLPNNKLRVTTIDSEDGDETEDAEWRINKDGHLEMGETKNFDSDDVWVMRDGKLYAYDVEDGKLGKQEKVYLERIK